MKFNKMFFALITIAMLSAGGVFAQNADFSMTNNTGMTLIDVFISPSASDNWGSDVIPTDMILDGETFNFTFSDVTADQCIWDIMFTGEDGIAYYMRGVDLCTITTITLSKN
jgi:hypothetical protein